MMFFLARQIILITKYAQSFSLLVAWGAEPKRKLLSNKAYVYTKHNMENKSIHFSVNEDKQ